MDIARRLLETTQDELRELAPQRGFTHATRLKLAFRRELGIASAVYRQRTQQASRGIDDGRELRRNGNRSAGWQRNRSSLSSRSTRIEKSSSRIEDARERLSSTKRERDP